jgi:hypothetical protein
MKRSVPIIFCAFMILLMSACSYIGELDYGLFEQRFNEISPDAKLASSNTSLENSNEYTKYTSFFDAEKGGRYMMAIYSNRKDSILYKCTLCVLSSIELDIENIEELFTSMLYAYASTEEQRAKEIFVELGLDDKETYKTIKNTTKEIDNLTFEIIVSGAGTAITVN